MKIADINCMLGIWPTKLTCFPTVGELYKTMDSYHIGNCVAYHSAAVWNTMPGNMRIKKIAEDSSGRITPCYVLAPNLGSSEIPEAGALLSAIRSEKPAAIRLFPKTRHFSLDPFYSGDLLDVLNAAGLPVLLDRDEVNFETLPETALAFPKIKFVLLRRGFCDSRYVIPLIRKLENIYFDCGAMLDTGLIEEIVSKYGSGRLLFGSGLPFYSPAGALSLVLYARIRDQDKENILYENWNRIGA